VFDVTGPDAPTVAALSRLEGRAQLAARFSPHPEDDERFGAMLPNEDASDRLWPEAFSLLADERIGPKVEIWRLP
jgi:hypothetical protein